MFGPLGAFGDPAAEEVLLRLGEFAIRIGGGHDLLGIVAQDAEDEFARVGFAGDDGGEFGFSAGEGGVALVEAEAGFAVRGVGAVAVVAVLREDGLDVAIEADGRGRGGTGERGDSDEGERGEQDPGVRVRHGGKGRGRIKTDAGERRPYTEG